MSTESLSATLRLLAHPHRRAIIFELKDRPRNVREIADALRLPPRVVRYHLRPLCDQGLVESTHEHQPDRYRLRSPVRLGARRRERVIFVTMPDGDQLTIAEPTN